MKMKMRKNDRSKAEEILKRSSIQDSIGITGTERVENFLLDRNGQIDEIGGMFKGLKIKNGGIPELSEQNFSLKLDCGHTAKSLDDVKGKCYQGHLLCQQEEIYKCSRCTNILCDLEVLWDEDLPFCPEHVFGVTVENSLINISSSVENMLDTLFGRNLYE